MRPSSPDWRSLPATASRGAARDYFDVDAIRRSGRFTDDELLQLVAEHDPGFDLVMFAEQLARVATLRPSTLAEYGVSPDQLPALQRRLQTWGQQILTGYTNEPTDTTADPEVVDAPRTDPRHEPPRHLDRPPRGFSI